MMFDKYISWPVFMASFITGLIFIYYVQPRARPMYIYPSPDNVNSILFQDAAKTCFKFHMIDTICPADRAKIKNIPVQI